MTVGQIEGKQITTQKFYEKPLSPILVFDIETVPDVPLLFGSYEPELPFTFDEKVHWNDLSVVEAIKQQHQINFPSPIYHMVICICAVYVHPETHCIMDGFKRCLPKVDSYDELRRCEADLLRDFWAFTLKHKDRFIPEDGISAKPFYMSEFQKRKLKPVPVTFCGYNICGFDLPVIEQRSLAHLLTCPIAEYGQESGYSSYRSKFALEKCFDLCHYIANQSNSRAGLDVIARAMGLGGKMAGMDGSKVAEHYFVAGQCQQIEEYCAVDVLVTYGVYLAVQKFRGILDEEQFIDCLRHFERFLNQEGKPPSYAQLARSSREFFSPRSHDGAPVNRR